MTKQKSLPATKSIACNTEHVGMLPVKTEIFFIKKKGLELKITMKGKKSISVEVFSCKDVNVRLANTIAMVQKQMLQAEALCHQGSNFHAHLLTVLDNQKWTIQTFDND